MVWAHRPPVVFDWSSTKLKILGVFVGHGNLEEDNWRPRINAVDHVLRSWRSRSLSFPGKALIINALALSRVWYVASLDFSFFWFGKRELVYRSSVTQSPLFGGFSVVDVNFKVYALFGQC